MKYVVCRNHLILQLKGLDGGIGHLRMPGRATGGLVIVIQLAGQPRQHTCGHWGQEKLTTSEDHLLELIVCNWKEDIQEDITDV